MPEPTYDASTGWWKIRWYAGPAQGRVTTTLVKQPGWVKGTPRPRRIPPEVEMLARKYQDMELRARHGVDVAPVRETGLGAYLGAYLAEYRGTRRLNSARVLRTALEKFLVFCAGRGVRTLQAVTAPVCRDFLADRLAAGAKRKTVEVERAILAPAFRRAADEGLIGKNPWQLARLGGRPDEEEPPYWTVAQLARLLAACRRPLRDIAAVAVGTGLRAQALLDLRWEDIDWTKGVIVVRPGEGKKVHRRYEAPLTTGARVVLQRLDRGGTGLVFPGKSGKVRDPSALWTGLKRAARRAGLPDKGNHVHILRHTFATLALQQGVPIQVVSRWLGHTNITQTMRYGHHCPIEGSRLADGLDLGSAGTS